MPTFQSDGVAIAYEIYGEGDPVLLIHGFASNGIVNWVETGWTAALTAAGWQAITIDNRGHGLSEKLYDENGYRPAMMAGDAVRLLGTMNVRSAPVIGYSMGARIAAFMALAHPERVTCSVWGGMAMNLVTGLSDSVEIIAALTAPSLGAAVSRTARQFRAFAERTGADRRALAACMVSSREPMLEDDVRRIEVPVLVAAGENDTMADNPAGLAALLPQGEAVTIPGRDHMRTTGDPRLIAAALSFMERHR